MRQCPARVCTAKIGGQRKTAVRLQNAVYTEGVVTGVLPHMKNCNTITPTFPAEVNDSTSSLNKSLLCSNATCKDLYFRISVFLSGNLGRKMERKNNNYFHKTKTKRTDWIKKRQLPQLSLALSVALWHTWDHCNCKLRVCMCSHQANGDNTHTKKGWSGDCVTLLPVLWRSPSKPPFYTEVEFFLSLPFYYKVPQTIKKALPYW